MILQTGPGRWLTGKPIFCSLFFILPALGLLPLHGDAGYARRNSTARKIGDASYAPSPTEADLFNALRRACYGSEKDRSAADALFRRVLRNDDVKPVSHVFYPVYGSSPDQIQASQAQSKLQAGISEWGYTNSKWTYSYRSGQPVRLTLQTLITMPKWKSNGFGRAATPAFWRAFYSALLFHEQGHALIGEYVVALMRLRLNSAGGSASANAGAICNQVGAEMDTLNQQYDQATNHGVSQGARL